MPLVCSSNPWWLQVYNTHERERRQNNSDCQKKSLLHLAESLWALELERTSYLILLLIVLFSTQVLHPDIHLPSGLFQSFLINSKNYDSLDPELQLTTSSPHPHIYLSSCVLSCKILLAEELILQEEPLVHNLSFFPL